MTTITGNLIEDQKKVYICLMMKMKLPLSEDEPKQKLNRRSGQHCNAFCFFFFFQIANISKYGNLGSIVKDS
jgi:hypothetical protein